MGRKKIVTIVGTRPQFIKAAALEFDEDKVEHILVHTGQHWSYSLSKQTWKGLRLREPDHLLSCGHSKPAHQFECLIRELTLILQARQPDYVIVIGDCNTTLGGALAANFLKIPLIHIEAGLRCFDMSMPEERNRKLVDHLSQVHFCVTAQSRRQLVKEIEDTLPMIQQWTMTRGDHIYHVGDLLHDAMALFVKHAVPFVGNYILATIHREDNADNHIEEIMDGLNSLDKKVVFPKHPRIKLEKRYENIEIMQPVDFVAMLSLELGADMIFTDSGGVQREAIWMGKPCVLMRETTEFPEYLDGGHMILVGHRKENIVAALCHEWPNEPFDHGQDGQAGIRIAEIIYGL